MAQSAVPLPPPGFDRLAVDEQVDYVQSLWDSIAANVDQVPLHEWQQTLLDRKSTRLNSSHT